MKVVVRTLVVAVLVAVATSVGASSPVQASTSGSACPTGGGITVVVDYQGLSAQPAAEKCDTSGRTNALALFNAHFGLTYFGNGGVCTINGLPQNYSCARMHSPYWSLWWANPSGGSWVYSQTGASDLAVPAGGFVAFSWDSSLSASVHVAPRVAPRHSAVQHPVPSPSSKPTSTSHPSDSQPLATSSPSTPASATASTTASGSASATVSASIRPTPYMTPRSVPGVATDPALPISSSPSHGLAWWVAPAIIALLAAAGGAIWFVRRRP